MAEGLSIWSLIIEASFVVQLVMFILFVASVTSWVMIANRFLVLKEARELGLSFEDRFWSGIDLGDLYQKSSNSSETKSTQETIFVAGFGEFLRLRQEGSLNAETTMDAVQRAMRVAFSREQERLEKHLSFLATVGSTSPYIGLFGTVWGIMNSFQSIAISRNTSLAIVAPGIAEALFATALGLLAAIPAVVAYNKFNSDSKRYFSKIDNFSKRFLSII